MISYQKAKSIINKHVFILEKENVDLINSPGRILGEDVVAYFPSPIFNNSAMDGFAVRAIDTKHATKEEPIELKIVDISSAGSPSEITIGKGECVQCMTGAEIPKGADAIII